MTAPVTGTPTAPKESSYDPRTVQSLNDALHGLDGFTEFTAAAQGFIKGEIDLEQAIEVMTPFLRGDIVQGEQERERIIQLGQTIEAQCSWASVTATITACTPTFSCSIICC